MPLDPGADTAPSSAYQAGDSPETVRLESESVLVEVAPPIGGKITSLYDKRSATEWLWRNPQLPFCEPEYGDSYVERLDSGGWDEVFPSVQPCEVAAADGAAISVPDHGDLVQLPWTVTNATGSRLEMEVAGRCVPFEFRRGIELAGDELRIAYEFCNTGSAAFPWIWCVHPLLPLASVASLDVDTDFRVLNGLVDAESLTGASVRWADLPPKSAAWAVKLFSARGAVDRIGVHHENGASLWFGWDRAELPYLALWVNNGGWSGTGGAPYYNLGIEPTTAADDDLSRCEPVATIPPGETAGWSLSVRLSSA